MRCGVVVCLPIIRKSRPFQFHWQSVVSFSLFICLILSCAYTDTLKDNRDPISCQGPVLDAQMVIPGASHLHHWSPFPSAQNWNSFSSRCLVYPNFSGDIPLLIYATEFRQCSLPPRYNSVAGDPSSMPSRRCVEIYLRRSWQGLWWRFSIVARNNGQLPAS